jgi:hypothetical protein
MTRTGPSAASIRAIEPIYVAAMLEELQLFDVVDRLVQLFQSGLLPAHSSASSRKLYEYRRQQPRRLSRSERESLYARALGLGGDDAGHAESRVRGAVAAIRLRGFRARRAIRERGRGRACSQPASGAEGRP